MPAAGTAALELCHRRWASVVTDLHEHVRVRPPRLGQPLVAIVRAASAETPGTCGRAEGPDAARAAAAPARGSTPPGPAAGPRWSRRAPKRPAVRPAPASVGTRGSSSTAAVRRRARPAPDGDHGRAALAPAEGQVSRRACRSGSWCGSVRRVAEAVGAHQVTRVGVGAPRQAARELAAGQAVGGAVAVDLRDARRGRGWPGRPRPGSNMAAQASTTRTLASPHGLLSFVGLRG